MSTLKEVVLELQKNRKSMEDVERGISALVATQLEAEKQAATRRMLDEEKRREAKHLADRKGPEGFVAGLAKGAGDASGFNMVKDWAGNIMSGLFGGVALKSITGAIGMMVGRGLIFGGAALLIGTFGEKLFTNLIESLDPSVSSEDARAFSSTMTSAFSFGAFGLIFGKRFAAAMFAGSLLSDALDNFFTAKTLEAPFIKGFGEGFTNGHAIQAGSTIAAFFGAGMLSRAISSALSGGVAPAAPGSAPRLSGPFRTAFAKGFVPRLGWAAVFFAGATVLANALGSEIEGAAAEQALSAASWAINGATIGMMLFGPSAAIPLAIAGLVGYSVKAVADYIEANRQQRIDAAIAGVDEQIAEIGAAQAANDAVSELEAATASLEQLNRLRRDTATADAGEAETLRLSEAAVLAATKGAVALENVMVAQGQQLIAPQVAALETKAEYQGYGQLSLEDALSFLADKVDLSSDVIATLNEQEDGLQNYLEQELSSLLTSTDRAVGQITADVMEQAVNAFADQLLVQPGQMPVDDSWIQNLPKVQESITMSELQAELAQMGQTNFERTYEGTIDEVYQRFQAERSQEIQALASALLPPPNNDDRLAPTIQSGNTTAFVDNSTAVGGTVVGGTNISTGGGMSPYNASAATRAALGIGSGPR